MFQVARAIRKIYNAELREFAVHEKVTATGQVVNIEKPDWSVESIVRHLLLSPETEAVFETYQNQVYVTACFGCRQRFSGATAPARPRRPSSAPLLTPAPHPPPPARP